MTWSPGPVVTRRRLGGELKRLREGRRLKLEDVARRLECSPSKISRLENGKGVPRWRDVRDMLDVYGVPDGDERERLLRLGADGPGADVVADYRDVLPPAMATYVELEWDARADRRVRAAHRARSPADAATTPAGRAATPTAPTYSEPQIERLVEVRMRRQEALDAGPRADVPLRARRVDAVPRRRLAATS